MKAIAILSVAVVCLSVAACGKRSATVDTGSAKATVSTDAPKNLVTDSQLETQAAIAATGASKPVDGSGPVNSITPTRNTTSGPPSQ